MKSNKSSEWHSSQVSFSECRKMDRKTAYYMLRKIKRMPVIATHLTDRRSERFKRLAILFLLLTIATAIGSVDAHTDQMCIFYSLAGIFLLTHHVICAAESYNCSPMTDEDMLRLTDAVTPYTYVLDVMKNRLKGRTHLTQKEGDMFSAVCRKLAAHESVEHPIRNNSAEPQKKQKDCSDQNPMIEYGGYRKSPVYYGLTRALYVKHTLRSKEMAKSSPQPTD